MTPDRFWRLVELLAGAADEEVHEGLNDAASESNVGKEVGGD